MIELFIPKVAEDLALLDDAMKKRQYQSVKDTAHSMKSTLALFLLTDLTAICSTLEIEADGILKNNIAGFSEKALDGFRKLKVAISIISGYLIKIKDELYSSVAV